MTGDGRKPDRHLAAFLFAINLVRGRFYDVRFAPSVNRRTMDLCCRLGSGRREAVLNIRDIDITPFLRARVYRPSDRNNLPVILFFHGGGWIVGSINGYDNICRKLANRATALVISVNYRLSPENRFPSAVEDAYTALKWTYAEARSLGGDLKRIAVCGDSAGGNLAAVTCLVTRDRRGPQIGFQALVYPATDASNLDTESFRLYGKGYYLTRSVMAQVIPLYVSNGDDVHNPYVSPLLAAEVHGLPPALIITAEFDPLSSEGKAYADRLLASGIYCKLRKYAGMIHGFISMSSFVPQADTAISEIAAAISEAFE